MLAFHLLGFGEIVYDRFIATVPILCNNAFSRSPAQYVQIEVLVDTWKGIYTNHQADINKNSN